MIDMSYQNGTIDESIKYFNEKYPYYMVKNMHQLFLQITKEGAQNSADSLENMQLDIDMLVESVYRDRIDRAQFHKQFIQYGLLLYLMIMLVQLLIKKRGNLTIDRNKKNYNFPFVELYFKERLRISKLKIYNYISS